MLKIALAAKAASRTSIIGGENDIGDVIFAIVAWLVILVLVGSIFVALPITSIVGAVKFICGNVSAGRDLMTDGAFGIGLGLLTGTEGTFLMMGSRKKAIIFLVSTLVLIGSMVALIIMHTATVLAGVCTIVLASLELALFIVTIILYIKND